MSLNRILQIMMFVSLASLVTPPGHAFAADKFDSADSPNKPSYEPTSSYDKRTISGFTVYVSSKVTGKPEQTRKALALLEEKLEEITHLVPAEKLEQLQKAKLWVERSLSPTTAAQTHHSVQWLRENGYNPDKVNSVEISNISFFESWSTHQPMMVLHELAHYYHRNCLNVEQCNAIDAAYKKALKSGSYESVDYVLGGKKRAYALTNADEYFAELTESYFGNNDFYPFNRSQLSIHDPAGFQLMVKLWGEIEKKQ